MSRLLKEAGRVTEILVRYKRWFGNPKMLFLCAMFVAISFLEGDILKGIFEIAALSIIFPPLSIGLDVLKRKWNHQ